MSTERGEGLVGLFIFMLALALLFVIIGGVAFSIAETPTGNMTATGEITDVKISSGGFIGHNLTQIVFNDETSLVLKGIQAQFEIGHKYEIVYREVMYRIDTPINTDKYYILVSFKEVD